MIFSLMAASRDRPWLDQNNPAIWSQSADPVRFGSAAGEVVTPKTALGLPAYFACIRVLSEDTAKLPITVNKVLSDGESEPAPERVEFRLLNEQANDEATSMTVREFVVSQTAGWGNGYAELQWSGNGKLHAIWGLRSERMDPQLIRESDGSVWIRYVYENEWGEKVEIPQEDLIHIAGPSENGYVGQPVVNWANESVGSGLAQQKYGGSFFGNGAMPGGVLEHPATLSGEAQDRLRKNWEDIHKGSSNAWRVGILEEGMKYNAITISPKDAELIESRRFTIEEVARWFRMPLSKIQHHLNAKGWATTELENTLYLTDTLLPWLERVEQELDRKLFPKGDYFVDHDTKGLLKADTKTRGEMYGKMFRIGAMTINEIRQLENMRSIGKEGDSRFVPVNLQTLEKALKPDEPPPPNKQLPPPQDDEAAAIEPWVLQAAERSLRKINNAMTRLCAKHAEDADALKAEAGRFFRGMIGDMRSSFAPAFPEAGAAALHALCHVFNQQAMDVWTSGEPDAVQAWEASAPAQWTREVVALAESVAKHGCAA